MNDLRNHKGTYACWDAEFDNEEDAQEYRNCTLDEAINKFIWWHLKEAGDDIEQIGLFCKDEKGHKFYFDVTVNREITFNIRLNPSMSKL